MFILDASGSIHHERFPVVLDFVIAIIADLEVDINRARIAAITWSNTAKVQFYLNTYTSKQDVIQAISYIQVGLMGPSLFTEGVEVLGK